MVKVVAKQTLKEGKAEQLKESVKTLIAETRKETGCIKYELYQDIDDERILTMIEEWESMEHLQAHMQSKHFQEAMPVLSKLMEKEAEVNIYKLVL